MTLPLFVYGTLKRGKCREHHWPHRPRQVTPGAVRGQLFDLGPYPALVPGDAWVLGEVWEIAAEHLAETLRVLDEVEGYLAGTDDEYVRRVSAVYPASPDHPPADDVASLGQAYVYYYGWPERLATRSPMAENAAGWTQWPAVKR